MSKKPTPPPPPGPEITIINHVQKLRPQRTVNYNKRIKSDSQRVVFLLCVAV